MREHDRHEDRARRGRPAAAPAPCRPAPVDQPHDLRQRGVGADRGGPDDQAAVGVDRGADDLVAGGHLDRDGLAGQHRLVDRRRTPHRRCRRWRSSRPDAPRTGRPTCSSSTGTTTSCPSRKHARLFRTQLEQLSDRLAAAALRARLEVAAEQDQRRDHRRRPRSRCPHRHRPPAPSSTIPSAASVPSVISVSIVAAPWRAFIRVARWKPIPP